MSGFAKEELAKIEGPDGAGGIDIVEFIDPRAVDVAYFDKSYWVGPGGKSARGFDLLRAVLHETKRVALVKVKLRTRTRLAILRPRERLFALDIMRFADELVPGPEIDVPDTNPATECEVDLANKLVEELSPRPRAVFATHPGPTSGPLRAIWCGEIGFGLVCIPAKIYPTTRRAEERPHARRPRGPLGGAVVVDLAAARAARASEEA